jgi:solute carrier family 25 iron transporter 28/37
MASNQAGPSHPTSSVHIQPHGAHLDGLDEEEHDYESLPVGAGWGVNMAAGAMVS